MTTSPPFFETIAESICQAKGFSSPVFQAGGAFKETFRVEDGSGRVFALKVLDPAKCNVARLGREIDAMKRCDLPYIAELHEFGKFSVTGGVDHYFVVEEFFDGGTLTTRLNGQLPPGDVRHLAVCLSTALEELAALDLVHRDIKPDNVMFRAGSNDPILVDFGLVRNLAAVSLTHTWLPQGPGTPLFSSPEQLNNDKHLIKWRSDQFSLGIVLGICLTGQHPFMSPGMSEIDAVVAMAARKQCDPAFAAAVSAFGFPGIVRMLEPWPVQRFPSPAELIENFKTV